MFTDIVGYTALSQKDEALALQLLEDHRRLVRPLFQKRNGREVKTIGDAFLVEFASALEAVRCAFDVQQSIHEVNKGRLPERQVQLRIGVHVGDVVLSQNDVYGDAVNIASRIEPLASEGGVCLTRQVYDQIKNKFEFPLASIGTRELKNVGEPIEVFKVVMPWEQTSAVETHAFATNRIAILPFRSMSPDPNDEYFAEGITEEIISTVSGIGQLSVISRTSVMRYKGTNKSIEEIGRELRVGSVLEGSFRKAGNKIRVTTQLIDVAEDKHLWTQNYDRNLDDVFEVQSDVAKQVADVLRVKILSPERERIEKKPTDSTSAYTLYLKGRYLWNTRGLEDLKEAMRCFEQAVKEDPDFALGYVGVADSCLVMMSNWNVVTEANMAKAKAMLTKALELDPGLAEAHAANGLMFEAEYNLGKAEEEFKRAIELKPNYASAHQWYSQLLGSILRLDEAQVQGEKALELDPMSPVINASYGGLYYLKKDYRKALDFFKRASELGLTPARWSIVGMYGKLKMPEDARREASIWVEQAKETFPFARMDADAFIALLEDDKETIKRLLPQIEAHHRQTVLGSYGISELHFCLGNLDKGFEWLERAYSERDPNVTGIKATEFMDAARNDPRYLDILKRLGLD